jgi:hypothetical protein
VCVCLCLCVARVCVSECVCVCVCVCSPCVCVCARARMCLSRRGGLTAHGRGRRQAAVTYSCALCGWQVEKSENWIRDRMLGPSSVVYRLPSGPALAAGHLPTVLSIAPEAGARILCGGLDATCGAARALGHASACHTPPTRVNNSRSRPRSLRVFVCLSPAEPCCNPPLD